MPPRERGEREERSNRKEEKDLLEMRVNIPVAECPNVSWWLTQLYAAAPCARLRAALPPRVQSRCVCVMLAVSSSRPGGTRLNAARAGRRRRHRSGLVPALYATRS